MLRSRASTSWAGLSLFAIAVAALAPSVMAGEKLRIKANASSPLPASGRLLADYGSFQLIEADVGQSLPPGTAAEVRDDYNFIMLNAGWLDTSKMPAMSGPSPSRLSPGRRLFLVHFVGPVKPEWYEALLRTGVRVVTYIPSNAYLVYGDGPSLERLESVAAAAGFVQWAGPYLDEYKINPATKTRPVGLYSSAGVQDNLMEIQCVADAEANGATLELLRGLGAAPAVLDESATLGYLNIVVPLAADLVRDLAARSDVISIQPYIVPRKMDERQDQIMAGNVTGNAPTGPGYLAWLGGRGFTQAQFTASGFAVDVTDSGIDNATTTPNHFGLYVQGNTANASRVVYNRLEGTANPGSTIQGCDGHGNLNSHVVAGYNDLTGFPHADAAGFRFGLGSCPFVRVGSSVIFDPDFFTSPDYEDLQSRAYRDGARISTNSWGANVGGAYNSDAQRYDALVRDAQPTGSAVPNPGNQEMVILFSAGNAGSGANTMGSPGTAKNVFTVGAGENVHSHSDANGGNNPAGNDGCIPAGCCGDTQADSLNDIIFFSSRGPCDDQRKKPDIVAPGTHITGGVAQAAPPPPTTGTGDDLACFAATGVCALPGGGTAGDPDNFFPAGQQFYTTSSGTSHSTPAVAGGAALLRQRFINDGVGPPSPAMTKAYLMNAAFYMTGTGANDTLWSNSQGMGGADLGRTFDGTSRILSDQTAATKFTASGQTRTFTGIVSDPTRPFRVTVAWTDAPGSTTGNAFNNDLDLTVAVGGNTFLGNVFTGANSVTGGAADPRNNVESVFLPAGTTGTFVVTITAANINSDGVPNDGDALDQDFALVIYNAVEAADLAVTKSDVPDPVVTGGNLTYVIGLSNAGPNPAASVLLADPLPAGTTFLSLTAAAGWTCVTPPVGGTGTVNCTKASVAAGESAAFTLVVNVSCALPDGTLVANTVTASSLTLDTNPANNSATTTTTAANPPPVITCPADVTVPNDPGLCSAVVTYPPPSVTDNCPGVTTVCVPPSGSTFPVGQTPVTCTATDSGGAQSLCGFQVTVNDLEPPVVTCSVSNDLLWPPNHDLVNVGLTSTAVDNCSGPLPVTVAVKGDEDDEMGPGDGNFSPDAKDLGPGTLRLRSERVGGGDGRVYLIVPGAVDGAGNVGFNCCTVAVPHSQSPASIASVNAQAAAADAFCQANGGSAPPGYFVIGDGPVIGPKQ